jgi:hypothetical protein
MSLGLKPDRGQDIILRFFVRTQEEDQLRFDDALKNVGAPASSL